MHTSLQRIKNNKDKRTTRRTPRNRNPTPAIQPPNPTSPPDRLPFLPEPHFLDLRVRGDGLHPALDRIRGEEEEVVGHACAGARDGLLPEWEGGVRG